MIKPDLSKPLTAPFWQAVNRHELALPFCSQCQHYIWYPRPSCESCNSQPDWKAISGKGSLAGFSIVQKPLYPAFAAWAPYIVALVAIDESPSTRLVSQLIDIAPEAVECDMALEVVFKNVEGDGYSYTAPFFKPASF